MEFPAALRVQPNHLSDEGMWIQLVMIVLVFQEWKKPTRSSLKGVLSSALFAYKNGRFASSFLLLGFGFLEASKHANLSKAPLRNPI